MNKYYTGFLFKGKTPKELHCTHKYLGSQKDSDVEEIIKIIDDCFSIPPVLSPITFDVEDFFGFNNDIRVLRPSNPKHVAELMLRMDLLASLNKYRLDDYGFNPHVTTKNLSYINLVFTASL